MRTHCARLRTSLASEAMYSKLSGVFSDDLITTVLPVQSILPRMQLQRTPTSSECGAKFPRSHHQRAAIFP